VTDGVGAIEMFANLYDLERGSTATGPSTVAHSAGLVTQ